MRKKLCPTPFDGLLALGILSLTLDGVTAWTVNHPDTVPAMLSRVPHLLFFISLDSIVFLLFLYFLASTEGLPKRKSARFCPFAPYAASIATVLLNIGSLEYRTGRLTAKEFGVSKRHTVSGGEIIQITVGHVGNAQYLDMAYLWPRATMRSGTARGIPPG